LRDRSRKHTRKSSMGLDPIEFLVRFTNSDLKALSKRGWLKLLDDLAAFDRWGPRSLELRPDDEGDQSPVNGRRDPRQLRQLQVACLSLLQPIAERQSITATSATKNRPDDPESVHAFHASCSSDSFGHGDVRIGFAEGPDEGPRLLLSGPSFHILYVKAALLLLVVNHPTRSRLRCCPECWTVFLRIRKQQYCSRRCVNRANMRAWLKRQHGKASHRASSKRSYAKRVRARLGAKVQIKTRRVQR
jgi:hypothetical protein